MALTLFALHPSKSNAQDADALIHKIENYSTKHLEEKLFLHTDKTVYLSNEVCWFKIYNVDGFFNLPLSISSIAYVEILDKQSKAVIQEKVDLNNGSGAGSIKILGKIASGNYTLRAYTNWMKNYSSEFFFQKNITIINTEKEQGVVSNNPIQDEWKVQIFPEGGNLINGIENKIAYKISNQFGNGIDAKAMVINEKSDTMLVSNTLKLGMGNFQFKPLQGQAYKLAVLLPNGKMITENFPQTTNSGYALKVVGSKNPSESISISVDSKNISSSIAYIIGHARGVVKTFKQIQLENGKASFNLPVSSLGEGINSFTLFDENRKPVAERLFFKYPEENMGLAVSLDAKDYAERNKVALKLTSFLQNGKPTAAELSMSVYKIDELQSVDESNIQNYIWLTSDLVGKVESPNSYFNFGDPQRVELMDNLMLTNGWRRFKWDHVLNDGIPAFDFVPEIAGKIVTGRVVPANKNLPLNGITAYLSMPSKRTQFHSSMSDQKGRLKFQFADFYNDDQVIAQIEKNNAANYKIEIESPFVKSNSTSTDKFLPYTSDEKFQISKYHRDLQVQNYYNLNYINKFEIPLVDTTAFYHKPDNVYLLDDYSRFATLEEVFREYMTPVKLSKSGDNFNISVYDNVQKRYFSNQPLILLDGYPISDLNKFMSYDPLKIRKIEIVDRMYFLGNQTYYGVLNFTTYNGKMETYDLDPQAVVLDFKGLQSQREFSAPEYTSKDLANSRQPDFRHLLYWSGNLNTSEKGKTDVSFFTSDVPGKYVIVVQGLSKSGKAGYQELMFDVKGR